LLSLVCGLSELALQLQRLKAAFCLPVAIKMSGKLFRWVIASRDVRFGSLADIRTSSRHVRFIPNNGRWAANQGQHLAVGL
jgi:hypothetical protein